MEKEEALNEFLKSLRIALNNSLAYQKDHPYFIECLNNLREKSGVLFNFLSPIKILFTPDSLFLDGRSLEKSPLYTEIARIFHARKVKSIEIKQAMTTQELSAFLGAVSLPVKELFGRGGMSKVLLESGAPNITAEDLDYSQVLKGQGEQIKDAWAFMIKEAMADSDRQKIIAFANEFQKQISKFRAQDLLDDEELRQNITKFLEYLKGCDREMSGKCSLEMFESVLKHKDILQGEKIDKIKSLFKHLSEEDFAGFLKDEILKNQNFDALSFQLFSRLAGAEKEKGIAASVLKGIPKESLRDNPLAARKVQELLSLDNNQYISEVYRNTLSSLIKGLSLEAGIQFDRGLLRENYHFIVLNLFAYENRKSRLAIILDKLDEEFEQAAKTKDFEYIKNILGILKAKRTRFPADSAIFAKLDRRLSDFVEGAVWKGEFSAPQENFLADALEKPSSLDAERYLAKIFQERKASPNAIKLFFRFFPYETERFSKAMEAQSSDIEFVLKVASSLAAAGSPQANGILRQIIASSGTFLKLKLFNEVVAPDAADMEFLLSILDNPDAGLRKEALSVLAKDKSVLAQAVQKLLSAESIFGLNNALLIENMKLIQELDVREAAEQLSVLSKRPFFWNSALRSKARDILKEWNVNQN